ncbi:M23 family metallopeptidase [Bacteriovoracaceae bacterium]|nr:M23 family metallopeptidase [Bacteriovoracaceae bacterium]
MHKKSNIVRVFIVLLVFASCSLQTRKEINTKKVMIPILKIKLQNITISPGKVRLITLDIARINTGGKIKCHGKTFSYYTLANKTIFALRESYFSVQNSYKCFYEYQGQKYVILNVEVTPFSYPSERIRVNKKRVFLNTKDQARANIEQKMLNKIYAQGITFPLFKSAFKVPLKSKITSKYGMRRIFNEKKKTQHLGTDFRASIGVPIPVSNTGKVIFAGNLFYTGNTVIVDHGLGIYSVYGHLSKFRVNQGDFIQRSTVIGFAGSTGRSSGPHLHWGVKVHGQYIDGFSLIQETKDFNKLL